MAFEEIKDRISEQFSESWGKVQESSTYNTLRERYETLSPAAQRGLVLGSIAVVILFLFSLPSSYLSSASTNEEEYENNRQMIRSLLRASRLANEASSVPASTTVEEIKGRVQGELSTFNLLPEQIGGVIDLDAKSLGTPLAPATLQQSAVGISLKKLNLNQIVEIGYRVQDLNPTVKLAGIEIAANQPDNRYFDVLFKLAIFRLPESANTESETGAEPPQAGPRRGTRFRGKGATESQGDNQEEL